MQRGSHSWLGVLILGGIILISCSPAGGIPVAGPTPVVPIATTSLEPFPTSSLNNIEPSPSISCENVSISNPAGAYCSLLGYTPGIVETAAGQMSTCALPDGTVCDAWEFLSGKCGQDYSYCAQQGYGIQTVSEGGDSYSQEYAVCLDANGKQLGPVSELSGLHGLLKSCANQ